MLPNTTPVPDIAPIKVERPVPGQLRVCLRGAWRLEDSLSKPHIQAIRAGLSGIERVTFNTTDLDEWDSSLLIFLRLLIAETQAREIALDLTDLPDGVQRLLKLASLTPPRDDTNRPASKDDVLQRAVTAASTIWRDIVGIIHFVGQSALALWNVVTGRGKFNVEDLWPLIHDCGPKALPIVTLVSFLVGTVLAYMGAVQLQQFGAQIYIANMVGLGMAREMAAIMTGVVIAGRSGAAFAAQLGTMQVNEELDALETLGISPVEHLVLPRMLALILMVPLLTLYANFMGIVGGMLVATSLVELTTTQYFYQTVAALELSDFVSGLIKASTYGVLIAIAGCMRGMQCGRSAQAVGEATTSAVVTSIVFMVIAAAILTVTFHEVGL